MSSEKCSVIPSKASTAWLALQERMYRSVTIHVAANCQDFAERIELSSGTRLADVRETADLVHGAAYERGAWLPREPWRSLTKEETRVLIIAELPSSRSSSVALVKLPDDFSEHLSEFARLGNTETFKLKILHSLRTICELGQPLHCIGPIHNPPNLKTITVNHNIGRYNGLHVDNWDALRLDLRHLATNRICVNIGQDDRYFLFLPFTLTDIARVVAEEMGPSWEAPPRYTLIGRQFMELFPHVPVVRCRLKRGEAYIAPTENLVHDGSSLGQTGKDEQYTVRGHIRLF